MEYLSNSNGITVKAHYSDENVKELFLPLLEDLIKKQKEKQGRLLVFLAAPPGTGKTTLCEFLNYLYKENFGDNLTVIGMDGFHHYNDYLESHEIDYNGQRIKLKAIKGQLPTFNVQYLKEKLEKVAKGENVMWPVYDRQLHNPREDAIEVNGDIVILEGIYIMMKEEVWKDLSEYADYTIFIKSEPAALKERLIRRKMNGNLTYEEAKTFIEMNDMVNATKVLNNSKEADLNLELKEDYTFRVI